MGLFSDFFGSSSHTQTTQSTSNVTNTQLAGGSIDAPTVYGTGNSQTTTINTVDPGAIALARSTSALGIAAGADIAARGIQSGVATAYDISQAAIQLGAGSNYLAGAVTANALDFGTSAIGAANKSTDAIARFAGSALDTNASVASHALDSVSLAGANALDFSQNVLTDSIKAQAALTGQNLSAVSGLAAQVSQSATQSVNDSLQKIVLYIALAYAASMIFKGGR